MAEQVKEVSARHRQLSVTDKLRLLLDITKKISRSLDLHEVINLVMDTLDTVLPYDAAGIYVIQTGSQRKESADSNTSCCVYRAEAVRGYDIEDLVELRLKMGEGIIG